MEYPGFIGKDAVHAKVPGGLFALGVLCRDPQELPRCCGSLGVGDPLVEVKSLPLVLGMGGVLLYKSLHISGGFVPVKSGVRPVRVIKVNTVPIAQPEQDGCSLGVRCRLHLQLLSDG